MRPRLAGMGLATGWLFLLLMQANAAPLELKQVSGDAKWLAHVDFDAMRDSIVVKKAVAKHLEEHKSAEAHLKMVEALIGLNPRHDLHSATLYGKEVGKHKGVMILHAKLDQAKLQAWAEKLPGREKSEYGSHKISSWTKKGQHHSHTVASAWLGDDRLVIASSVDELKTALDVLDGRLPSVGSGHALAGQAPAGTTVLARVTGIADAELPCHDPVAKQTKSFRFVVGEHEGESFLRARAEMTNTEVTGQLKEVVEGGQAVARLASGNNEQKLRLVNGLRIKPEGDSLTLLWKGSAEDVWQQVEEHAKKWKEMRARIRDHRDKHADRQHSHKDQKDSRSPEEDF